MSEKWQSNPATVKEQIALNRFGKVETTKGSYKALILSLVILEHQYKAAWDQSEDIDCIEF